MSDKERRKIKKRNEMRTEDISRMIDEGGLGADKYYDIVKNKSGDNDLNYNESRESQRRDKQDR